MLDNAFEDFNFNMSGDEEFDQVEAEQRHTRPDSGEDSLVYDFDLVLQ